MTTQEQSVLEAMVDRHGLKAVVETLADVCFDKEAHIKEAWMDYPLAATWSVRGNLLQKLANKLRLEYGEEARGGQRPRHQ